MIQLYIYFIIVQKNNRKLYTVLLSFLVETNVIDFHGDREDTLVDATHTTPVTTPGEVKDGIEGIMERPLIMTTTQFRFRHSQLFFVIYISNNLISRP